MKYSELAATATYRSVPSGAAVRIVIYDVTDGESVLIGSTTGISWSDDFEQNAVEESGNEGVEEFSTGRHTGQANSQGFFRPETNDKLPTRQSFLATGEGREYTIIEVMGDRRVGENVPINVFTGCKINRYGSQQGARGLKTFDLAFVYQTRYNGTEWMTKTGDPNFTATSRVAGLRRGAPSA